MSHDQIDREGLIALCERGIVRQDDWHDRDSKDTQVQLGECWALLKAGCAYQFSENPKSDDKTWWVRVSSTGFSAFEWGDFDGMVPLDEDLFYIPTDARLDRANGKDWY